MKPGRMVWLVAAAGLVRAAVTAGAAPPDPAKPGPYPVGVTRTLLVDAARTDALTGKPRTLVTEIWYPADDAARDRPKNRFRDFLPVPVDAGLDAIVQRGFGRPTATLDTSYWNHAVRDARVREGRYPLVVFSHGNGGTRYQNTFWCDHLASHGYVIVSADHTGNARFCIIDGEVIPYAGGQRAASAKDRPLDMRFLLDAMIRWDHGADSRFAGRIDTEHVAAAGMSFGAYTAVRVAAEDPRFKAVIPMAGGRRGDAEPTTPTLLMRGAEDRTIGSRGNDAIRAVHDAHAGPSYLLTFRDGGHFTFTDMFKINPVFGDGVGKGRRGGDGEPFAYTTMERSYEIINAYATAFCGVYLKRQPGYAGYLRVNHWPDVIEWDAKPGE